MKQKATFRDNSWIIVAALGVILFCFVLNTIFFQKTLNEAVALDLYNDSRSVAEQISFHIKAKTETMTDFADTLARMPERVVTEEMLYRKAEAYDMDAIAIFRKEGQTLSYMGEGADLTTFVDENWDELTQPIVMFLDTDTLVYAAPILADGELWKVAVGKKDYSAYAAHYYENAMVGLVDRDTDQVLVYQKGAHSSIGNEMIQTLWKQALANPGELMQDGKYMVSDEPVAGTSWAYISMIYLNDVIPEFTRHIVVYVMLAFIELLILLLGLYLLKMRIQQRENIFLMDPLTGGLNRSGFIQKGEELIGRYGRANYYVARFNITGFRHINEAWGEIAGNSTLKFVYRMLKEELDEKETLCRVNVDHFLLFLHESDNEAVARRVTESIERINDYVHKNFYSYDLQFQAGACSFSYGQDVAEVIRNAVYVSKISEASNVCVFYDKEMMERIANSNELAETFYESLQNRDFKIYLQPKVGRDGGYEAEALVRWMHPKKGLLFPGQFIPLFEQNGKIMDLDLYVFEELCRTIFRWMEEKKPIFPISVNISRYSLLNAGEGIYKRYGAIKKKYEIPDGILEIELTETILMDGNQISFVRGVLEGFRSFGFRVALDDFGFAYSSLGLLKDLDVDTIKFDRTFFVDENRKSEKIVSSMIQLIHSLNMNVVAEGIELEEQTKKLYEDGCDYIQGYVYSKAISLEEFEEWKQGRDREK